MARAGVAATLVAPATERAWPREGGKTAVFYVDSEVVAEMLAGRARRPPLSAERLRDWRLIFEVQAAAALGGWSWKLGVDPVRWVPRELNPFADWLCGQRLQGRAISWEAPARLKESGGCFVNRTVTAAYRMARQFGVRRSLFGPVPCLSWPRAATVPSRKAPR